MNTDQYEERLKKHNWNYKNCIGEHWTIGHKEYSRLIELSTLTPEHRRIFLYYKKINGVI